MWELAWTSPCGQEWEGLLSAHPHLLFHEAAWLNVCETGFGAEPVAILLRKDGEAVAGMAGFLKRIGIVRLLYLGFPYGGIVGEVPADANLAPKLRELARGRGIMRVTVSTAPFQTHFPEAGFTKTPLETHILPIAGRTHGEILAGVSANRRRDVRKAAREGVEAVMETGDEAADALYAMYLETMKRNDAIARYTKTLMVKVLRDIVDGGRGGLLLARYEGTYIAAMLIVDSARGSHYLFGASRGEFRKLCPSDFLIDAAIQRAVDLKHDFFDFLPSGAGNESLVQFKAKWGGEVHPVPVYSLETRPVLSFCWNRALTLAATRPARALISAYQGTRRKEAP